MSTPTFVLIPGHFHTLLHLEPLVHTLTRQGHRTRTAQLHSVGRKPIRPTFADDVSVIYGAVAQELLLGRDVCLVLHSYAGVPGAEAVNRLVTHGALEPVHGRGRLVKVIFIAAYTFPAGVVMDAKATMGPSNPGYSIDENEMSHMASPWHYLFNDLPLSAAKPYVDALGPTYYLGAKPVITTDKWRKAPIAAILCKKDNALPADRQERMWKGTQTEWIDAGHTPYVSRPDEVAGMIVKLLNGKE